MSMIFLCATLHLCPAPQYRVCWRPDTRHERCAAPISLDDAMDIIDRQEEDLQFHIHRNAKGDDREAYIVVAGRET